IVDSLKQELDIAQKQQAIGAKSLSDTLAVRSQLAATEATLPSLEKQLSVTQNQLATYLGVTPAQLKLQPVTLADVTLPADIPVSLPSTVVAQRPDIRAASAQLHAATAAVGLATADMLPKLTLNGSLTSQSLTESGLLAAGSGGWSIGLGLLQPLFHGGQLLHPKRAWMRRWRTGNKPCWSRSRTWPIRCRRSITTRNRCGRRAFPNATPTSCCR